jgi:hypothetical protein
VSIPVRLFPYTLIALMFAASVVYGIHRDWRHAIYWFAAGVLNLAIT